MAAGYGTPLVAGTCTANVYVFPALSVTAVAVPFVEAHAPTITTINEPLGASTFVAICWLDGQFSVFGIILTGVPMGVEAFVCAMTAEADSGSTGAPRAARVRTSAERVAAVILKRLVIRVKGDTGRGRLNKK